MLTVHRALHSQVMSWIPQNDVLAHPRARAFLSHAGINSVYEARPLSHSLRKRLQAARCRVRHCVLMQAVYHGVPLISLPCGADQYQIATVTVAKVSQSISHSQAGMPACSVNY